MPLASATLWITGIIGYLIGTGLILLFMAGAKVGDGDYPKPGPTA